VCAERRRVKDIKQNFGEARRVHKLLVFLAKWGSCKKINNPLMDVATAAAINGLFASIVEADSIFLFKSVRRLGILSAFKRLDGFKSFIKMSSCN
jgi:hypothetical protein